jgi:signal transduction histidine kinase
LFQQYDAAAQHPVHFERPVSDDGIHLCANREKLQQVFLNLLENAAQHSPAGSEIRIVIRPQKEDRVQICVQDQGTGLQRESMDEIFEPFYTTRKSGTGLGMSIVKHIVEKHGGTISAHNNEPGPGCCIELQFPVVSAQS